MPPRHCPGQHVHYRHRQSVFGVVADPGDVGSNVSCSGERGPLRDHRRLFFGQNLPRPAWHLRFDLLASIGFGVLNLSSIGLGCRPEYSPSHQSQSARRGTTSARIKIDGMICAFWKAEAAASKDGTVARVSLCVEKRGRATRPAPRASYCGVTLSDPETGFFLAARFEQRHRFPTHG